MTNESAIVQSVPVESEAKQVEHRDGRAVITPERRRKTQKTKEYMYKMHLVKIDISVE